MVWKKADNKGSILRALSIKTTIFNGLTKIPPKLHPSVKLLGQVIKDIEMKTRNFYK